MTQMEALELALRLAIAAPDQKRLDDVMILADQISAAMTPEEVEAVQEEIQWNPFANPQKWQV